MADYHLVVRAKGPAWDHSRGRRAQAGWDAHAAFMDGLAEEGFVVLGGPVGEGDGEDVLLVVDARSEATIRARLAEDPWPEEMLTIESIRPWSVWLRAPWGANQPTTARRAIRSLGEVALRVNDLAVMRDFYEHVAGLEPMRDFPGIAFFRIAEGYGGHTTILALFDRDTDVGPERTTLDHLAFTIDIADYESERRRLEQVGLRVEPVVFDWVGWRSLFFRDPERNLVELVCRDPALLPDPLP